MLFFKIKDKKIRENVKKKELLNLSLKFVYTHFLHKYKKE